MKAELGDLDRVVRIVKVLGMVNAAPGFGQQPEVINGCSDLFVEVFGEQGPARPLGGRHGQPAAQHHGRDRGGGRGGVVIPTWTKPPPPHSCGLAVSRKCQEAKFSGELVEEGLGVFEVLRIEPFGEPVVDRSE